MDMELKTLIKKFCSAPTMADIPLRLKPGLAPLILKDKRFFDQILPSASPCLLGMGIAKAGFYACIILLAVV